MERALSINPRVLQNRLNIHFEPMRHQSRDWKQDVLLGAAVLAGLGAFFGPFSLTDPRSRWSLASIVALVLLKRLWDWARRKWQERAIIRDQDAVALLNGAIIRRLTDHFRALVDSNDGLGWLGDGMASNNPRMQEFGQKISPALSDARDVAAVILLHKAQDYSEIKTQADALFHSIKRLHELVAFAVTAAHQAAPNEINPASRGKAHAAYLRWQAFLDEYKRISQPENWETSPFPALDPLPSFR